MKRWLVQRIIDGEERYNSLMGDNELISYINMDDCHNEDYKIFDVSDFGNIKEVYYTGWQPNCLIELIDENKNVVLRGYGTDH